MAGVHGGEPVVAAAVKSVFLARLEVLQHIRLTLLAGDGDDVVCLARSLSRQLGDRRHRLLLNAGNATTFRKWVLFLELPDAQGHWPGLWQLDAKIGGLARDSEAICPERADGKALAYDFAEARDAVTQVEWTCAVVLGPRQRGAAVGCEEVQPWGQVDVELNDREGLAHPGLGHLPRRRGVDQPRAVLP